MYILNPGVWPCSQDRAWFSLPSPTCMELLSLPCPHWGVPPVLASSLPQLCAFSLAHPTHCPHVSL